MAWAEKLPSGRYRAVYRVGEKRRNATPGVTYTRRADAERAAGARETDQRAPGALDPDAGRLTWGTWVDHWWPRRRVQDSTRTRDESRRRHHLDPRWSQVPLADISRDDVEGWLLELAARPDLSPSTVQRVYHLFSASMRAAAVARRIPASPCVSMELERPPLPDEVFLTRDEVEALGFHLPRRYRLLVQIATYTGLRWSELVALHRQRVHLDTGRVDVVLGWDAKNRLYGPPKDHERRSVPLPDWLAGELDQWFTELGPAARCGVPHPMRLQSRCASGLVLPGRAAVPVNYNSFHHGPWRAVAGWWSWTDGDRSWPGEKAARAAVGEDAALERVWSPGAAGIDRPFTIHSLRHTYASWLLQAGVSIEQVSKLMGHASVLTTQRYAHLAKTQWDGVRAALGRTDGGGGAGPTAVAEFPVA